MTIFEELTDALSLLESDGGSAKFYDKFQHLVMEYTGVSTPSVVQTATGAAIDILIREFLARDHGNPKKIAINTFLTTVSRAIL